MNRTKKMSWLLSALTFAATAFAQQADHGTADQAKAMLIRAVAAVKADKAKAIEEFNAGADGFRDRDLYVFCANVDDGKVVAQGNPNAKQQLGQDNRTFKDSTGKPFGKELYAVGKKPEGQITEVNYLFLRPGAADKKPVPKTTFVTHVRDLICGVGYYK
jgi:hypothetical protein